MSNLFDCHVSSVLSSKTDLIPTVFSSSTSSPFLCISTITSHPPTNSPPIKTCGIVGHFVYSLIPENNEINDYFKLIEIKFKLCNNIIC